MGDWLLFSIPGITEWHSELGLPYKEVAFLYSENHYPPIWDQSIFNTQEYSPISGGQLTQLNREISSFQKVGLPYMEAGMQSHSDPDPTQDTYAC